MKFVGQNNHRKGTVLICFRLQYFVCRVFHFFFLLCLHVKNVLWYKRYKIELFFLILLNRALFALVVNNINDLTTLHTLYTTQYFKKKQNESNNAINFKIVMESEKMSNYAHFISLLTRQYVEKRLKYNKKNQQWTLNNKKKE